LIFLLELGNGRFGEVCLIVDAAFVVDVVVVHPQVGRDLHEAQIKHHVQL
jgi:hypothetical protein